MAVDKIWNLQMTKSRVLNNRSSSIRVDNLMTQKLGFELINEFCIRSRVYLFQVQPNYLSSGAQPDAWYFFRRCEYQSQAVSHKS